MMHEYARAIKLEEAAAEDKSFTVLKFRSLHEVCQCVEEYQQDTCTHFIKYNRDKHFGDEGECYNVGVLVVWYCMSVLPCVCVALFQCGCHFKLG